MIINLYLRRMLLFKSLLPHELIEPKLHLWFIASIRKTKRGFTRGNSGEVILKHCSDNTKEELKTHFVSESEKVKTASHSEPKASSPKVMTKSKPENQKTKVMNNSKSKAPKL